MGHISHSGTEDRDTRHPTISPRFLGESNTLAKIVIDATSFVFDFIFLCFIHHKI